jgi:putative two-component system response regulator
MLMTDLLASIDQAVASNLAPVQEANSLGVDLPRLPKIMVVDDDELNTAVVTECLHLGGYDEVTCTNDPIQALSIAIRERPDAVLLDLHMPRLSGFDVLRQLRADPSTARTPVVILTSSTDEQEKLQALQLGATDFLPKPFHSGELLARLRNILMAKAYQDQCQLQSQRLEDAVKLRTAELEASRLEVIHCLARAAEFRDDNTGNHVIRVGRYARIVGAGLGLDDQFLAVLEQAAKLHDIGKIGIPDAILLKPSDLTLSEFEAMQRHANFGKRIIEGMQTKECPQLRLHTELGAKILDVGKSPILTMAMRIALTHHERWDGTGYPLGLAGNDIPLEGRITAVADVFDALSTKRPYKPALPLDQCFDMMSDARGTHFDPLVLDAFFAKRDDIVQVQIANADIG